MKKVHIYPDYYNSFHCIADKCPDNCCEKWEIVVDDESASIYENIKGDIGKKIRSSITIDDDGDRVFILQKERCPFLEKTGLCEIHRTLGEGCLCKTCREYPRAVQDCGDFAEYDLSLSCPEAARIILLNENRPEYISEECEANDEETCYDASLMEFIKKSRSELLDIIWDKSLPIDKAVEICMAHAVFIQQCIDGENFCLSSYKNDTYDFSFYSSSFRMTAEEYLSGNILTSEFRERLLSMRALGDESIESPDFSDSAKLLLSYDNIYRQLCTHYISRYLIRALFDKDAEDKIFIMTKAYDAVKALCLASAQKNKELQLSEVLRIIQLYSKETEHNTE